MARKPRVSQSKQHWVHPAQPEAGALSVYPAPQPEPGRGDPKRAGIPRRSKGRGSSDDTGFCRDPCAPRCSPVGDQAGLDAERSLGAELGAGGSDAGGCAALLILLQQQVSSKAALGMLSQGMGGPFPTLHKSANRVSVSSLLLSLFPRILQNSGLSNLFGRKLP